MHYIYLHGFASSPNSAKAKYKIYNYLMVHHYGEKRLPLSYEFLIDANQYQEQLQRPIPTLILHGQHDEVIPIQASRDFAQQRSWVDLIELNSNHALGNAIVEIWQAIEDFCQLTKT